MACSRHTDPPSVVANRAKQRGLLTRPRVIERRVRRGDVHPIPKSFVEALLTIVPSEYMHGLQHVELRARQGRVGEPYAQYRRDENIVVIYSVPTVWEFELIGSAEQRSVRSWPICVVARRGLQHQLSLDQPTR